MTCWFFLFNRFSARIINTIACTKFDRHSVVNLNETQCKFRKKSYSIKFGKYDFEQTEFFLIMILFSLKKIALFYIVVCLCPFFFLNKHIRNFMSSRQSFYFQVVIHIEPGHGMPDCRYSMSADRRSIPRSALPHCWGLLTRARAYQS